MRLAKYNGEKKLSELVERLYRIEGRGSRAVLKDAEEALLKANPHLRDLRKLPEGVVIVVPPVPEAGDTAAAAPFEEFTRDLVDQMRKALNQADAALADSARAEIDDAREGANLLKSREFKALADKFAPAKDRLVSATQHAKVRLEKAEAVETMRKQAIPELEKQLEALARRLA